MSDFASPSPVKCWTARWKVLLGAGRQGEAGDEGRGRCREGGWLAGLHRLCVCVCVDRCHGGVRSPPRVREVARWIVLFLD